MKDFYDIWGNLCLKELSMSNIDAFCEVENVGTYPLDMSVWTNNNINICDKNILEKLSGSVIDIACGAGRHLLFLEQYNQQCTKLVGIDISPRVLLIAQSKLNKAKLIQGDMNDIFTYIDECFDNVTLFGNSICDLGSMCNIVEYLKKIRSLLSEGGKLIIGFSDCSMMNMETIQNEYSNQNIRIITSEYKSNWHTVCRLTYEGVTVTTKEAGYIESYRINSGRYNCIIYSVGND